MFGRKIILVVCIAFTVAPSWADSIIIKGKTYTGVKIYQSDTRYYFRLPDGSAVSAAKADIQPCDIIFGDKPLPKSQQEDLKPEKLVQTPKPDKPAKASGQVQTPPLIFDFKQFPLWAYAIVIGFLVAFIMSIKRKQHDISIPGKMFPGKQLEKCCPYLMEDHRRSWMGGDLRRCEACTKLGNPMADPRLIMGFDHSICESSRHRSCAMFRMANSQSYWVERP